MPLATPALTTTIATALLGSGMLGTAVPRYASGLSLGITLWAKSLLVNTIDAGVVGVGVGFIPFLVPQPVLLANLLVAYPANGQLGPMAPLEAVGLANGISLGLLQGFLTTTHPSVGTGAGVARVSGPPAFSSLMIGFSSVGMPGPGAASKANAISIALMVTIQSLVLPIPIVGPGGPMASSGSGFGTII
jgi:hypothetical protein